MTELIRPSTVEYAERVTMTYTSPRSINRGDEEPYRDFTIAELEDILQHARLHDAEDDTIVDIDTWGRQTRVSIVLPKHWADISTAPIGRYAPVVNRFWRGYVGGVICSILLLLLVLATVNG